MSVPMRSQSSGEASVVTEFILNICGSTSDIRQTCVRKHSRADMEVFPHLGVLLRPTHVSRDQFRGVGSFEFECWRERDIACFENFHKALKESEHQTLPFSCFAISEQVNVNENL